MKRCPCGTVMTSGNHSRLCGVCEEAESKFRNMGEREAVVRSRARQVAYCYAHPEDYETPASYGEELTARLDALSDALGIPPPQDLVSAWKSFLEPLRGVVAIVGEVSEADPGEPEMFAFDKGEKVLASGNH